MTKPTAGKWKLDTLGNDIWVLTDTGTGKQKYIATVESVDNTPDDDPDEQDRYVSHPEALANGRLMAAAKDLLEACKAALPMLSAHAETGCDCPDSEACRLMRTAIAKAEEARR